MSLLLLFHGGAPSVSAPPSAGGGRRARRRAELITAPPQVGRRTIRGSGLVGVVGRATLARGRSALAAGSVGLEALSRVTLTQPARTASAHGAWTATVLASRVLRWARVRLRRSGVAVEGRAVISRHWLHRAHARLEATASATTILTDVRGAIERDDEVILLLFDEEV